MNKCTTLISLIYGQNDEQSILDYIQKGVSKEELTYVHYGYNAFSMAIVKNKIKVAEALLSLHEKDSTLFDINLVNGDRENALILCVKQKEHAFIQSLLNYEIRQPHTLNIEQENLMNESFLHHLFFHLDEKSLDSIKLALMIDYLNVNIPDLHGQTPLMHLMHTFHSDEMKKPIFDYLIEYNQTHQRFDFKHVDKDGYSAFLIACMEEDIASVLKTFLDNPQLFDLYGKLKNGKNALAIAQDTDLTFIQLLFFEGFKNSNYLNDTAAFIKDEAFREKVIAKAVECEKEELEERLNIHSLEEHIQSSNKTRKIKV
jgi:ankyrin repeat protein